MKQNISNKDLVLLDLFSGTGGFHAGLKDAGLNFKQVYFSEIDKHAIANYKYNFKNAKYIGAVEKVINSNIERPNIITFGSPCQDFSIAGNRAGLSGERSSLIEEAIATITHFRPDIFIWENVKGAFSSNNSQDFWSIIQAFANIGGYELEWQLINTSWILPQNRERIYLVGSLAKSFRNWRKVFPIIQNDTISIVKKVSKEGWTQTSCCRTIRPGYGSKADSTYVKCRKIASCLTAGGNSGGLHSDMELLEVCVSMPGASAVLSPSRLKKRQNGRRFKDVDEPSFTLTAQDKHGVFDGSRIRRLTEIECERLQGYQDDWTKYGDYDGVIKELSGTQRYKLCGNSVTKLIPQMIGKKIIQNL